MTRSVPRRDEGFTLIELVMALTVLAVAILGFAGVFSSGIRTAAAGSHRTTAVALASRWIEQFDTVPYPRLALDPAADTAACDAGTTVVQVTGGLANVPDQAIGGVTYAVHRCVAWASDTAGTSPTAYKHTTVQVAWTDGAGAHTVRQDSASYPATASQFDPTVTTTTLTSSRPACTVGTIVATPTLVHRDTAPPSVLDARAFTVTIESNGACSPILATYSPTAATADSPQPLSQVDPTHWQVVLPPTAETWDLGTHLIRITSGSSLLGEATVCVVNAGAASC